MNAREVLADGLLRLGVSKPSENRYDLCLRLWKYYELVQRENERFGLVKFASPDEFVVRHLLDSLSPWKLILSAVSGATFSMVDLGSGAGLPGIPLALAFPETRVVLAERKGKRSRFLEMAIVELELSNVELWPRPFEELKERFPVAVFRAFSPLEADLLKLLRRILAPGGTAVAYKGRRAVLEAEVAALDRVDLEIVPLSVPLLSEERHAVILKL